MRPAPGDALTEPDTDLVLRTFIGENNEMIDIRRGDELGEGYRRSVTEVLVNGFAADFEFFSRDPHVLAEAFEHMVILKRFYVALVDGQPAAIASVTEGAQECFAPDKRSIQSAPGTRAIPQARVHRDPTSSGEVRQARRLLKLRVDGPQQGLTVDVYRS